eukprot:CAMPEP_0178627506 /NCGR_PEP_ID=MMETSP0698-20121128/8945_1 /TAXON_ID=265572 /ORGANISM="Extubocellulus spinifer, Strain CCMP396" /LENGTH=683 /DNA_ID=CAMNT_0020266735 /DNA_START=69 /DNA_END=2120 /DNA_ORIENTATION=-
MPPRVKRSWEALPVRALLAFVILQQSRASSSSTVNIDDLAEDSYAHRQKSHGWSSAKYFDLDAIAIEEELEQHEAARYDEPRTDKQQYYHQQQEELPSSINGGVSQRSSYIIGGTPAPTNRYKYMASLTTSGNHECGASLIAPDILLTAAHCTLSADGKKLIGETILIGRHNLDDASEDYETHIIDRQVIHPWFEEPVPGKMRYDFKLIKIYGQSMYPLVKLNFDDGVPNRDTVLTLMGWGSTGNGDRYSPVMRHADVNYVRRASCERTYDTMFEETNSLSTVHAGPESLCHYTRGKDSCSGDSGGPVIIKGDADEEDLQVALTSWGFGCAQPGIPAVNMRISSQSMWIKSAVCSLSSAKVPDYFECNNEDYRLSGPDSSTRTGTPTKRVAITIEIQLNRSPERTGWVLETARDGELIKSAPIGTYRDRAPYQVVREVVTINDTDDYKIVFLDTGTGSPSISYAVYGRGGVELLSGGGTDDSSFGRSIEHTFSLTPNSRNSIALPWVVGMEYDPMSIALGDEIVFSSYRSNDVIQFKSREHYIKCDYTDSIDVPKSFDGRNTFQSRRTGKFFFGNSRNCLTGQKIEVRVRKSRTKGFNKARGRPCDSNSGTGSKKLRVSSTAKCQRQCRSSSVCYGYQFVKRRNGKRSGTCTHYEGRPTASPISRVRPELLDQFKEYTCGALS